MKICAIRLENIRRFVDPVEITGFGPGLNLLTAPNEQGKSTIFDALHVLFFKDAKSWDKEIRALVPHAGGDPRIEVELEQDGKAYRVAKQFFKSPGKGEVRIWQGDRLLHQADAAEEWLKGLIKQPKDGGPSGLLWVRQGLTSFEDAKATEQARRDLLSSVAGEVGVVTGGQRMDAIAARVQAALDERVTKRGARKGGALDLAEREVAEITGRRDLLLAQVQELRQLLDRRRTLRQEQVELNDPDERAALAARLEAAEAAMDVAKHHEEQLARAAHAVQLAETLMDNHQRRLDSLTGRLNEAEAARVAHEEAAAAATAAVENWNAHSEKQRLSSDRLAGARDKAKEARKTLNAVLKAASYSQAEGLRRDLDTRLEQARSQAAIIARLTVAKAGPDDALMRRIEQAREALNLAQRAQDAAAAAVTVKYDPAAKARLLLDEAPIEGGKRLPLPEGGHLVVPGIAVIEVHPGQTGGTEAVEQAQSALAEALERAGCASVEEARAAFETNLAAQQQRQEARALLNVLAPDGVEALSAQRAALPQASAMNAADALGSAGLSDGLPDQASAEAACHAADLALDELTADHEALRNLAEEARLAMESTRAKAEAAAQRLERAEAAVHGTQKGQDLRAELLAQLPGLRQSLSEARAREAELGAAAPDFAQVRASLQRARSAQDAARQRGQDIARDLAVLDARIAAHAGAAVEEELADAEDQLARAQKRLAAEEFEVAVLRRLLAALDGARKEARDQYLGPIMAELRPLLRVLWPQARLTVDAENVLPEVLERDGEIVGFDSLSGGAQEQIALLVRLAFARLLARAGRPAPVILDDAIVYTDDARIEKIFDALTLQAQDQQIIVFSCRQKAFRGLGGTPLSIRAVGR